MCHCLACQRRTGSPFGAQARFAARTVSITGRRTEFVRTSDEAGERQTFRFCPDCGATVYYTTGAPRTDRRSGRSVRRPGLPAAEVSVYEIRRHPWVVVPEGAEHYD